MSTTFGDKMILYVSKKSYVKSLPIFLLALLNSLKKILFFLGGGEFYIQRIFKRVSIFIINIYKNIENNRKYF